ncbi:MAG: hypothetical protein QGG14_09555 [Planctomycetota bacterium]|jgi:hypothetical protein|nr:hypothetical protein [Planctomycetota bacterium]
MTVWLCVAAAVLVALLPAVGITVCMGHDGHVGVATTTTTTTSPCACDHGAATAVERGSAQPDDHPPCDDVALDPPLFYRGVDSNPAASARSVAPGSPPASAHVVDPISTANAIAIVRSARARLMASVGALRPSPQLGHQRVIVLLI